MEMTEVLQAWEDPILRDYLWAICGSFAHHELAFQIALYADAWCKLSWCDLHYDTASLMDWGFYTIERKAWALGLVQQQKCPWNTGAHRMARRRMRFFVRRKVSA